MTSRHQAGVEAMQQGRFADARKQFEEHEAAEGTAAQTREWLAEGARAEDGGDLDTAARQYLRVLERNPTAIDAVMGMARVALMLEKPDAMTFGMAAVKLAPQQPRAWTLLGLAHEAAGDPTAALSHLEKGASLGPRDYLSQYNLGRVLVSLGRAGEGVPYLAAALSIEPKRLEANLALGAAQLALKNFDKALQALEGARALDPERPEAWSLSCDALFAQRKLTEARALIDRALETVGEHPALFEKALACATALQDFAGAVDYQARMLAVVPDYEEGWMRLARFALLAGDGDKSEAAAKQLIELDPENYEPWFHLGNLYDSIPDEAKAEDAYRRALKLAPGQWQVHMNFGAALVQTTDAKKHAEAKTLLEEAVKLAPAGEWRAHYNLALAHVRLNENAAALELARRILREARADDPMVEEAKKLESNLLE